jgi:hypothetical protein
MPTEVISVLGCEGSGSAAVERAIHDAFEVTTAGDLSSIWARGMLGNGNCGCGQPFRACPFWSDAISDAFGSVSEGDARQFDRVFRTAGGLLADPAKLAGSSRLNAAFREIASALYQSVRKIGGGRPVIDSSKAPTFAVSVRQLDPDVFGGLHIFRDGRGNVHDLVAANERLSFLRAIGRWSIANWRAGQVAKGFGGATAIISYERFCVDQDRHLAKLKDTFGFAERHGQASSDWHRLPGLSAGSGPGKTQNQPEEGWRSDMNFAQRFLTRAMTGIEQHMLEASADEWLRERPRSARAASTPVVA